MTVSAISIRARLMERSCNSIRTIATTLSDSPRLMVNESSIRRAQRFSCSIRAAGKSARVDILSPSATAQVARKFVEASHYLEHFSLHPHGHSLALIARGQPLTMGNWEGPVIQHGAGSRVRYRSAEWLCDGQRFVVLNDANGGERLEIHRADQSAQPEVIDRDLGRVVELRVSPASDLVALSNHRQELLLINLRDKKVRELDRSPFERIHGLAWSGDGRWIAYCYAGVRRASTFVSPIPNPVRFTTSPTTSASTVRRRSILRALSVFPRCARILSTLRLDAIRPRLSRER